MAKTAGDPSAAASAIEKEVWSLDRDVPVDDVATMQQAVDRAVWQPRSSTKLFSGFAALALVLAAMGIYGVISYGVSQRRHEIGIRMALGARPADVLRSVLGEGALLVGAGTAIGLAGPLALTRYLRTLLYEVSANDPAVLAAAAGILAAIALAAAFLPGAAGDARGSDDRAARRVTPTLGRPSKTRRGIPRVPFRADADA